MPNNNRTEQNEKPETEEMRPEMRKGIKNSLKNDTTGNEKHDVGTKKTMMMCFSILQFFTPY